MTRLSISPIVRPADPATTRRRAILDDVRESFARTPRELSPKYFYDERGSRLFEEITRLPEYYLTRAEREILVTHADDIVRTVAPCTLIELGAGSAEKTRLLLRAMRARSNGVSYVPIDVSEEFLDQTRARLQSEDGQLRVVPLVADIGDELPLPRVERPALFAFLGSTIGNFTTADAIGLLRRIRGQMGLRDRLLLGTDLRKDAAVLNAAYNDAAGVTAEFNRNMLRALNVELGADFVPDRFEHRAFYDEREHRIEMHLVARGQQIVNVPGLPRIVLRDGESIRTELSHKYDRNAVDSLTDAAQLRVARWLTDSRGQFALSLLEPTT
ncbi:MAG TPA: L-histidine N(alpha)-methyltransferase [Gemmatimonadaceae bacterium]|jgi:L-histidine N-alpha-methyltransferase|nr:L-histidine N(alpha)-methyltransferase [Gemmatimonadaceae bacterium]